MKNREKVLIIILLLIIIVCLIILLIKINSTPKYDVELYSKVYKEVNEIVEKINTNNNEIYMVNKNYESSNNNNDDKIDLENISKTSNIIGLLSIEKIGMFYPILNETTEEYLKISPTKYKGGEVNEPGNLCIVGHNYRDGTQFSRLSEMEIGDNFEISDRKGNNKKYVITKKYNTEATDTSCTNQDDNNRIIATLITCTNNKNIRLVIQGESIA